MLLGIFQGFWQSEPLDPIFLIGTQGYANCIYANFIILVSNPNYLSEMVLDMVEFYLQSSFQCMLMIFLSFNLSLMHYALWLLNRYVMVIDLYLNEM